MQRLINRLHGGRATNETHKFIAVQFFLNFLNSSRQAASFRGIAHRDTQPLRGKRLHDKIRRTLAHSINCQIHRSLASNDDDIGWNIPRAQFFEHLKAVHIWQMHIKHGNIRRLLRHDVHRLSARFNARYFIAFKFQIGLISL